jgi:hypothetical protein
MASIGNEQQDTALPAKFECILTTDLVRFESGVVGGDRQLSTLRAVVCVHQ